MKFKIIIIGHQDICISKGIDILRIATIETLAGFLYS
jgi:hypothetical protein